jgi:hypothetical protein
MRQKGQVFAVPSIMHDASKLACSSIRKKPDESQKRPLLAAGRNGLQRRFIRDPAVNTGARGSGTTLDVW